MRGDNRGMRKTAQRVPASAADTAAFRRGSLTVVTLGNPREKFWGMVLTLSLEGLSLSGFELSSFDNVTSLVKSGEPFTPAVVFFPMHRIERVELDRPEGPLPSLAERFQSRTGMDAAVLLASRLETAAGGVGAQDKEPA
jgi:hypothetical protein